MSKIVIAVLFFAMVIGCLTYANAASLTGNAPSLNANGIIKELIGQYEAKYQGHSVIHPEQRADVIDVSNLHI